jgi:hypothetical protein
MFYNLKKLKDASSTTRPLDFYVQNGVHTLSLQYPMVVFCDEETVDIIKRTRNIHVNPNEIPTVYIVKPLTEYDFYSQNFPIIEKNRSTVPIYDSNNRNTTSYFLITMFKSVCLLIAKQRNDFDTQHYAWVDLGCNHVLQNVSTYAPKMLENPNPKISACYIHYRSKKELDDMQSFFSNGGPCGMAATVFTADRDYIDRFYSGMMQLFHEQLCKGTGHSDEQVMTYCYDRYPELFHIYNGEYYSILTNYHEPTADINSIRGLFVYCCVNAGRNDLAREATKRVLDALEKKEKNQESLTDLEKDIQTEFFHLYNTRLVE